VRGAQVVSLLWTQETQLSSITEKMLIQFFSEFKKNHVIDTQHSLRRILRRFYNWAKDPKRRLVKNYPIAAVELGRLGNKSRRSDPFCTKVQRDMLIAQAPDDDMRFVLYMGFQAGLRKLEIMEARRRWFHIDGDERYMEVRKAEGMFLRPGEKPFPIKDSVERDIPISKDFKAFLRDYLKPDLTPLDFVLRPEVMHRKSQYRVVLYQAIPALYAQPGCELGHPSHHAANLCQLVSSKREIDVESSHLAWR
jgi:integrase